GPQNTLLAPTSGAQTGNPLAAAVSQLAQDLKSGNLTAAQSDLANVQQDLQQAGSRFAAGHAHHHHHHADADSGQQNSLSALFGQLGQDLQSGNLSAAQQAYASLQQDFQQSALVNSSSSSGAPSAASGAGFSVSA
ncbi:MAG TPA: hypothetical protein VFI45_15320, partial [Candidatus Acidoferrum sp.]|nr:hypothetical protein [Candidatus Acidoferrum sp.]